MNKHGNASPKTPGSQYDRYKGEELPASDQHPVSQPQPLDNTSGTAHGSKTVTEITLNQVREWFRDLNPFEDEGVYADDILDAFIVGSEAKGTATSESDIDIAIVIPPITGRTALQVSEGFHMAYGEDLPIIDNRDVDLQFFYPNDPELAKYSKIPLRGQASIIITRDEADDRPHFDALLTDLNASLLDGMRLPPACAAFTRSAQDTDKRKSK